MANAIGTPTLILRLLREEPATAQMLAKALGLDVSSVRRHLDGFIAQDLIEFDDHSEGPGRPKRRFSLTAKGQESFPRDYAFLLEAVLAGVEARAGREVVRSTYKDLAKGLASKITKNQPMPKRLESLRQLYADLGFEASLEATNAGVKLIQRNCPFLRAAKSDPEGMCECLDEGIIRTALPEANVQLGKCMATGDSLCTHTIEVA